MNKLLSFLYSTRLTGVLFIVFAAAMGIATFIENDYGTQTAKALIYHAWWFEAIMVIFVFNFFGNIFKYRLYRKEKWSVLLFHLAFVLIIIGAGVTRYISYEGIMPIIEGESNNTMLSETTYFQVTTHNNEVQRISVPDAVLLSAKGSPNYTFKDNFKGQDFEFDLVEYVPNAKEEFTLDENGQSFLKIVESSNGGRHDHYLKQGESQLIHNVLIGYDNEGNNTVDILTIDGQLKIKSIHDGTFLRMADQFNGTIAKDSIQDLNLLSLHNLAGMNFVIPEPAVKGSYKTIVGDKNEDPLDKLVFDVTVGEETKKLELSGAQYYMQSPTQISVGGLHFRVNYGAQQLTLPFHVKLRDFQLDTYPGSENPMSYASEVTVIDPSETFDFRIFMNNVLNYKGYRFFQSSYNITPEYEETRLSVNHDFWGTTITYFGYTLLFLGLIIIIFAKNTRFDTLRQTLNKVKAKKAALTIAALLAINVGFSQHEEHQLTDAQIDSIVNANAVSAEHAKKFSKLVIQDAGGRMKPLHTFSSELLRKVSKKDKFKGLNSNQVFISMQQNPRFWFNVPMIYIKKENTKLRDLIGIPQDQKYARLADFLTNMGDYKLAKENEYAFKQKIKSKFDQSVLDVTNRVNVLFDGLFGNLLAIFPIPNDENNTWVSQNELKSEYYSGTDSVFVKQIFPAYLQTLIEAKEKNDYSQADEILNGIIKFQQKFGSDVYPSDKKIDLEVFYNENDIFKNLFWQYMLGGLFLFIVIIINIFNDSKLLKTLLKIGSIICVLLFAYHTVGLGIRWYISGHVPWSNGYESMIYIAWATMLFGLIFGKKSQLTIAATAFVTAMILMFAHMNWMDPEIANLVPVLDSYWVMIHVSIIVASYGPFTLCMILGLLALFLMIITNDKNKKKVKLIVQEITVISEMSMTLGIILLTIGNFLGAIWANESWGRYWGWDPKETWALISIMIYAFILHMRLIPGLRGRYAFNVAGVLSFASILMTYLGVNHLLSGLHSYAQGEAAKIPYQIWTWLAISVLFSVLAYFKYKKYYKK
ncbi:MAG: c-type cytochrome biogenesis protein CcsB [Bacteroidetes bacterium MedPE-SWsnd-G1]|nr:MAG: c-type cytochrome biogenesis protein CcsB [Bacteroidetes bacterium MedPE-SWsnd-G1]